MPEPTLAELLSHSTAPPFPLPKATQERILGVLWSVAVTIAGPPPRPEIHRGDGGGPQDDDALLAAYVSGDPTAFEKLYLRHEAAIAGRVRKLLQGSSVPFEDLVQETFLTLVHKPTAPERGKLRQWLFGVARNACLDALRKARQRETPDDVSEAPGLVDEVRRLVARSDLTKVAAILDAEADVLDQSIVVETANGRTGPEIAADLGVSAALVRKRLERVRERLRTALPDGDP